MLYPQSQYNTKQIEILYKNKIIATCLSTFSLHHPLALVRMAEENNDEDKYLQKCPKGSNINKFICKLCGETFYKPKGIVHIRQVHIRNCDNGLTLLLYAS